MANLGGRYCSPEDKEVDLWLKGCLFESLDRWHKSGKLTAGS